LKRLLLLRHAKAGRDQADDHRRALIERGRLDSARMGRFMRQDAYLPDLVLCSNAARTMETLTHLLPELSIKPAVHYLAELYLAEPEVILSLIRHAPEPFGSLMIVGHNPGIAQCAHELVRQPSERKARKRLETMEEKFPTCALAVVDFDVRQWSEVGPHLGDLDAFMRPKDIVDEKN
jgi:phosphohistidine phosphatase